MTLAEPSTFTSCQKCHATNKVKGSKISTSQAICGKCGAPLIFHKYVSEVDHEGLKKLLGQADLPVIVDFWAPWCGPCRQFAPAFESVSEEFLGKAVFIKINTENHPHVSSELNIRGIPTLILFKNNKENQRVSGALPRDQFSHWLKENLF